jgi:hypothetical protein
LGCVLVLLIAALSASVFWVLNCMLDNGISQIGWAAASL